MAPLRILFVCTGKLCRSPMAAGIARFVIDTVYPERSDGVEVASAGTAGLDGDPATGGAVMAMKMRGIDISDHRARTVTEGITASSDLVLTMEEGHISYVELGGA